MHSDWAAIVDLYGEICRVHEGGEGIKTLARKHKTHRRMVREALSSALPAERKKPIRVSPQLSPYAAWIENILETDVAPRVGGMD